MPVRVEPIVSFTDSIPSPASPAEPVEVREETPMKLQDTLIDDPNHKLTKEEALELRQSEEEYKEALAYVKDMIAPAMMRIDATKLQIGDTFVRTIFTYAYPDVLEGNWLSPLINWDVKFDVSMFVYPVDSARVMRYLRKRLTQLRSQLAINREK